MSYKIIYHGSNKIIEKPVYHYKDSNPHNDYGYGFYCTRNLDMAKEWSCITTTSGFANKYKIDERSLKILNLCDKSKYTVLDWVSILVHNRYFSQAFLEEYSEEIEYLEKKYQKIDIADYDVIIGYRADDAYFRFPRMFIEGILTYEKLEEIYLEGNLGKQYVLMSEKAFSKIRYVGYVESEPLYKERYELRKNNANRNYTELELSQRKAKGKRIRDFIEDDRE